MCSKCNKLSLIVQKSKKLCTSCNFKEGIKRQQAKRQLNKEKDKDFVAALTKFYKTVWDSQPKVCYETGVTLYKYHNWHVHHILEKKYYPEHVLNPDVCVLLTLEQHALWHSIAPSEREAKMPKTWAKYLELKQQYE